ncbi:AraC family transcriptional regulator [Cohnella abietis]|uniref:Fe3+-hydroxamate ABC transporter substrate-binding protein n=1 Tax=Cohnella abietis TaxID=2507935 RepID=A0A3T1D4J5_9BACL|nr:AraC family transcriptional regulator [Cohnella abietis]BBI32958.1 hypothetical protein KCTCHS21_23570 [Cohnella abietis]
MINRAPTSAPLRSLIFHLSDIELQVQSVGWHSDKQTTTYHTLLIVTAGTGCLHMDSHIVPFTADKCYLLSPNRSIQIENGHDKALRFFQISFTAISNLNQQPEIYVENIFADRFEMIAYPFSRLIRLTEEIYAERSYESDIESFKQQLRFQELLGFIIEHNLPSDSLFNSTQSVESTIHYLQNNYTHNITVKQLAQLANMPHWQFTPIFQELTGKRPLDFLTELRINRSKELLIDSNAPLREIAHQVGFTDEYYFNRRFRHTTGVTPKQYARYKRNKTKVRDWTGHDVEIPAQPQRIIFFGETFGDLLALGIEAIGGGVFWIDHSAFKDRVKNVEDVGDPINPNILKALKPDLIIFANADERQYSKISKIAPTVTFNTFAPLEQRMNALGHLLGRKHEVEKWLDVYNTKAALAWKKLQTHINHGETASVFIFDHGERLFVMGASGLSSALYHPFGFQPVDRIQEIIDSGDGFMEISAELLPEYAGDRIFMLLPQKKDSKEAMEELMRSALWRSLPAVQKGRVYVVEAAKWNSGDAFTRELLLEALPRLMGKIS